MHLKQGHRQQLTGIIDECLPGVEVWAYGSRVNGQSHDGSDLDLVLRGPDLEKIQLGKLAEFKEALYNSSIPFLVDIRDWARIPESFHREIERSHEVIKSGEIPP